MLRERDMETARLYGFADHVAKFQTSICQIKGIEDVDFDLSGFLSDIPYVIFLPKYNVPVEAPDYFEQRRAMLTEIIRVAAEFGMTRTEDRIEDYGAHWYIVTRLASQHYSKPVRYFSTQRPITPGSYPARKTRGASSIMTSANMSKRLDVRHGDTSTTAANSTIGTSAITSWYGNRREPSLRWRREASGGAEGLGSVGHYPDL